MSSSVWCPSDFWATEYSSGVSWITWPSPRRARDGGSLNPEPSNSPISSVPSARRGPPSTSALLTAIAPPAGRALLDLRHLAGRRHGTAVALDDVAGHLDVLLAADVDVDPGAALCGPPRPPSGQ